MFDSGAPLWFYSGLGSIGKIDNSGSLLFPSATFSSYIVSPTGNFSNVNFNTSLKAKNKDGITGNYRINGSTSQCWLNFTLGVLTGSNC